MGKDLSISICIPVWNGSPWLKKALGSVYKQDISKFDYEIILGDDNSPKFQDEIKKTLDIINFYGDSRINYIKNEVNLGYPLNLKNIVSNATKDIIFLMAQDDILSRDAIEKTVNAFKMDSDVGVVTRPYFWFIEDITKPIRAVTPPNSNKDEVVSITDSREKVVKVFESVGQLSGLAYKREYLSVPFHEDVFPAHIYPFVGIFRDHKCVFLKDYTLAVRIESSQTIYVSSIYDKSPLKSWVEMFDTVLQDDKYKKPRNWGKENITKNFVGLAQIKNYGTRKAFLREIFYHIRYRKENLLDPRFWIFSLGAVLTPRFILVRLIDYFKKHHLSKNLPRISFKSAV